MTDKEIVKQDIQELYLGNLSTVEFDLDLPLQGKHGSQISWESDTPHICDAQGKVTRPSCGKGNREVLLKACFQYGNYQEESSVKITVLEEKNSLKIAEVYPIQKRAFAGERICLPGAVAVRTEEGRVIVHGVTWEEGVFRQFEQPGDFQVRGRLDDTGTDVWCEVKVAEGDLQETFEAEGGNPLETGMSKASGKGAGRKKAAGGSKTADMGVWELEGDKSGRKWKVRLAAGSEFYAAQERLHRWLLCTDTDQWLYNFRKAAGLDLHGAPAMTGWDSPEGLLRGHSTGHYLSALALCFHATSDEEILKKSQEMVEGLWECQKAFEGREGFHRGFLSAYSEEQFDLLEQYTPYPSIWAPYYTLHKILAGLLDLNRLTGSERAAALASGIGRWVYERLSRLTHEQRTKMWSIYIAGEYGGMNEALAELYRVTGKGEYLTAARFFDNDKLFFPLEQGVDALDGMHANQHIPQAVGAARLYEATGEERYLEIARRFWQMVTEKHIYATGGTGEGEMFHEPGRIAGLLTQSTQESCATYNMLKLTAILYGIEQRAEYMDYYERALFNHMLSSCDHEATAGSTYFLSMRPGAVKEFDIDGNSCCHGTGMESPFKYGENIYFIKDAEIYVNLFLSSRLEWEEAGMSIWMQVDERKPGEVTLQIQAPGRRKLKIRKPRWEDPDGGGQGMEMRQIFKLDGQPVEAVLEEGYYQIESDWTKTRELKASFPCCMYYEKAPDDSRYFVACFGPYVLAAVSDTEEQIRLCTKKAEDDFEQDPSGELVFRSKEAGCVFWPVARIWKEKYQVYLQEGEEACPINK